MIDITNGVNHMTVSRGAFRQLFAPQGWIEDVAVSKSEDNTVDHTLLSQEDAKGAEDENQDDAEDASETDEDYEEESDEDEESDEEDDEELSEKPLSEMSYEELQKVAKSMGIKTNGLKSKKELRAAIKEV